MEYSNIRIKTDRAFTEVFIDGQKIKGVRRLEFTHGAGGKPILKLDLNALDLSVDGKILLYDLNSAQGMDLRLLPENLPEEDLMSLDNH